MAAMLLKKKKNVYTLLNYLAMPTKFSWIGLTGLKNLDKKCNITLCYIT